MIEFQARGLNYHKEVFDSLADGIVITNSGFKVIDINDSAKVILNTSSKKVVGKKYSEIFSPEINKIAEKAFKEERTISEDEIEFGAFLNDPTFLKVTASPYFSNEGVFKGLIIQLKDIEGIKFLSGFNNQQSFNSKFENLILGLAHELKNPLSGIKGAAQLLSKKPSKKEIDKCSEIIGKEADRLIDLLDRLKRIDDFTEDMLQPIDIHEILLEIIFLESKSFKSRIKFKPNFDVTIPPIKGDKNSLKQVFINLINNAVESISNTGTISLTTKWVNDYKIKSKYAILISVKDSGTGIPKDQLDKIFTPFFTTKESGSGLGLFLSNQIIAKHGGAVFVDSKQNEGSEFKIYLPA